MTSASWGHLSSRGRITYTLSKVAIKYFKFSGRMGGLGSTQFIKLMYSKKLVQ
jgi:hypothetical protein